ncbi:MAG: matrixin family metalloprotease [Caldilineaceae bacterium]|nr:matrixin family metalloprotease [Caldilineaceae bacterium]
MELAPQLRHEAAVRAVEVNPANASGSDDSYTRYWMPGAQIWVRFLDGDPVLHQRVASAAQEWTQYANIQFTFDDGPDAEIRINFAPLELWSYIGTDALLVPQDEPTLCLGALIAVTDEATIRQVAFHEFGHVLGLTHESSSLKGEWTQEPPEPALSDEDKHLVAGLYPFFRGARRRGSDTDRREEEASFEVADEIAETAAEAPGPALESIGPTPTPEPQSPPLIEEAIRLDVAHPEQAYVDEPFDLAVAVRQRDAPVLAVEDLPKTISEEGTIYREQGDDVIQYRIEVIGADCDVQPSHYVILLHPGENAKPRFFQVTAHRAGKRTLVVNAYQEDGALAAQTRMRIEVQMSVQRVQPLASRVAVVAVDGGLTAKEVEQLHEALLSAFNRNQLERVTLFGLDVKYENIVRAGDFSSEVFDLLEWAVANNKIDALLKQAREENPGNVKLREFVESIGAK